MRDIRHRAIDAKIAQLPIAVLESGRASGVTLIDVLVDTEAETGNGVT